MADETQTEETTETDDNAELIATINKVAATHVTRAIRASAKDMQEQLSAMLAPVMERISELSEVAEKGKQSAPEAETQEPKADGKLEAMQKKFEAQLRKYQDELENERKQKEEEKLARLRDEERSALSEALHSAGITGALAKGAHALLTSEGKVKRGDDGKIGFEIEQEWGTELLDLSDGIKKWMATDDGKAYLPPRGTQGSGSGPAKVAKTGNTPLSPLEAARQFAARQEE